MDPISITGTLIAVLQLTATVISVSYDYRQGVSSASREVLQISSSLNSLKDVLEALLSLIENSPKPSKSGDGDGDGDGSSRLATVEMLCQEGGTLENCSKELERLRSKLQPKAGWKRVRRSLVWPLREKEVGRVLGELERAKSLMALALSADQATLSMAIEDQVGGLTEMVQKQGEDQVRLDINQWLAAPDPYVDHVANRKKRQPQTGTWILRSKQYEEWLSSPKSFLWLYGIPGSGKTVLCSTIIEQLVRYCQKMPKAAVAYFYFDFNNAGKRDVESLIRSLVTQLSAQSQTTPALLLELYKEHQNGIRAADERTLVATLLNLMLTFHSVYIVLDALDESNECDEVLQFIHGLQSWDLLRLHILATSRQLAEIEESLASIATNKLCLQDAQMNEDIVLYIADKLQNDKKLSKWPPDIRLQIQAKLLEEEGGMFQWVVCQLDMFNRCLSVAAVRKALTAGLPKNLDQTYDQILSSIDEEHLGEVMKILMALTVTKEPLTLDDIVEILAVDLECTPPHFDVDSRLLEPRNILAICSSLVTISAPSEWSLDSRTNPLPLGKTAKSKEPTPILRLAHASVADYLTQSPPPPTSPPTFHFSPTTARQFLAQTCLGYLMNPLFATGFNHKSYPSHLETHPFLDHASSRWPEYLQREPGVPPFSSSSSSPPSSSSSPPASPDLSPRTRETVQAFFATRALPNGGNFAFWVGCLIPDTPLDYILRTRPLYYAASFGLGDLVRDILETEEDEHVDALGGRAQSSALHVAVYRNHPDVVRMLLERGADPNLPNVRDESPMQWARKNGEVRELLLEFGARQRDAGLREQTPQEALDEVLAERMFISLEKGE
ncbi:uncharacterized protein L3040_002778 [Drepanopeziza brunnea f. sp. 'multigermtubi']|uniref:NACHT domain protein n=1 Tax=Marssonina brunnea f. sp. multigermtubi (strain MB_m1) TaxID=1072389 RepID=K1WM07_MARBU|nr:NACHT domain protein [Drepanopeziza brunnea f. sp. 'multigermtubi' MB_m1]EKD13362.1 NACHT domain protein [Drepanopeziza brunnea f. sp. 'multigermtubi' MB_m1]KAJ5050910.1 hypothetical protein L3040_002778 [Drepanopeziza brunnea f. sp. 'multigermtubi']